LVTYDRDANFWAPTELEAVHPRGKAPVIEVSSEAEEKLEKLARRTRRSK
jgi:hypothetical protein